MTVVLISRAPSRELYERVAAETHVDAKRPAGLVVHTASDLVDGSVRIIGIRESQEDVDAFERDRLGPAFVAVGAPTGPPQREVVEPSHVIR